MLIPTRASSPGKRASIGAVALAAAAVNDPAASVLSGKKLEYVVTSVRCDSSDATAAVSRMLQQGPVNAVIGPDCSAACESSAFLTAGRNIAQISYSCLSAVLSDKEKYPTVTAFSPAHRSHSTALPCHNPLFLICPCTAQRTPASFAWPHRSNGAAGLVLVSVGPSVPPISCKAICVQFVRTTSSYLSWVPAVVRFTEWAAWSKFFVVSSIEDVYLLASQAVVVAVHATETISFRTGTADGALLNRVVASRCRVVLLLAASSDVLSVASLAKELGLDEGWAWLGLSDLAEVDREPGVPRFAGARSAMAGWVYFEATYQAPSAFYDLVREATRSSFPEVYEPADPVSLSAANLYDAVMMWAVVAGRHSGKVYDGRRVTEWLRNVSFDGVGGRVELDTNGDMKMSIQLVNYVDETGLIRDVVVGTYDAALQQYVPSANRSIIWPGGSAAIPSAALDTGDGNFSTTWILVGGGCGALLIIGPGGLIVFMKKKYKGLR